MTISSQISCRFTAVTVTYLYMSLIVVGDHDNVHDDDGDGSHDECLLMEAFPSDDPLVVVEATVSAVLASSEIYS